MPPRGSDDAPDEDRDQRRDVALKVPKRMGQKFHDRFVDAEDHPEHAAGDPGKHGAQSDERPLEDPEDELQRGHFFIQIMIHIFLSPFVYLILFHNVIFILCFARVIKHMCKFLLYLNNSGVQLAFAFLPEMDYNSRR